MDFRVRPPLVVNRYLLKDKLRRIYLHTNLFSIIEQYLLKSLEFWDISCKNQS